MEQRTSYCAGGSKRRSSSTAAGILLPIVEQHLPLVGVAGEQIDGVAEQLGHRLGSRSAELRCETGDFDIAEV